MKFPYATGMVTLSFCAKPGNYGDDKQLRLFRSRSSNVHLGLFSSSNRICTVCVRYGSIKI